MGNNFWESYWEFNTRFVVISIGIAILLGPVIMVLKRTVFKEVYLCECIVETEKEEGYVIGVSSDDNVLSLIQYLKDNHYFDDDRYVDIRTKLALDTLHISSQSKVTVTEFSEDSTYVGIRYERRKNGEMKAYVLFKDLNHCNTLPKQN
jgi:hypothetical protein